LTRHRSINRRYRQLAEEVGLQVACVDPIGWSATTVPEQTAHSCAELLAELEARLTLWRHQEHPGVAGTSRNLLACACGCPRRIRVAPATLQAAPIVCVACELPFSPIDS
jgi:hypothetical protein